MQNSKVCYFFIVLSIPISKVVSFSEDYHISGYAEDILMEKLESPEHFTSSPLSYGMEPEKIIHVPETFASDLTDKKFIDSINGKIEYGVLKSKCSYYKHGVEIDLDTIADVWQVVYYKLEDEIACFKVYIRKISKEEKKVLSDKYGSFSSKVNWNACDLEIRTNEKSETLRRHFLQTGKLGIMDNIIILEQNVPWKLQRKNLRIQERDDSTYTLHPENPDQWLVVNNLLLMRDCSDGDVVVFARVPHQPRRREIMDALVLFGEYTMEGILCK